MAVPGWWALPGMALLLVVHYVAVGAGGVFAFTDWRGLGSFNFVGLTNFVTAFQSPTVITALWNTLFLAVSFVVLTNLFGLLLALALNRQLKARYVLRTLLFIPAVLSPLAVSYVWKVIFQYDGPLNDLVATVFGANAVQLWLGDPNWAVWAVLTVMVWTNTGIVMVIYLAGLAGVPQEIEEAAAVDGASVWARFFFVVMPQLRPTIVIATTLMLIRGLRVFDEVIALTGGGPYGASKTLSTQVWRQTFVAGRFGYGSAIALVLTLLIVMVAVPQNILTRGRSQGRVN